MARKEMTLVYYYVPQDKDDPECPNVFGVPYPKQELRLTHIHEAFPLKGSYLFRFKYNNEGSPVWLDLPDSDSKLPLFKDRVVVKATRVSWNQSKLHSQYIGKAGRGKQKAELRTEQRTDWVGGGASLLEGVHPVVKKEDKKEMDLIHGFQKHGDLI